MSTIIAKEFPNESFSTKKELFDHLKANENNLIALKKATIKSSEGCNFPLIGKESEAVKGLEGLKDGNIYPIINTTNIMDSHNDVHLPKIWNKSLKEQQGRIFYVTDHDLKVNSVIAFPKDVAMSTKNIAWKDLGQPYEGETQALMFEVSKESIKHEGALKIINEKIDIEHSVRMQYVKITLALDSEAKEDKEYKKTFDKHIDQIANKQKAIENGYFWAVSEAKIAQEGSMVLFGSNSVTPLLEGSNESESQKDTRNESENSTHKVVKNKKLRRFV
jgi:hypothetical protein